MKLLACSSSPFKGERQKDAIVSTNSPILHAPTSSCCSVKEDDDSCIVLLKVPNTPRNSSMITEGMRSGRVLASFNEPCVIYASTRKRKRSRQINGESAFIEKDDDSERKKRPKTAEAGSHRAILYSAFFFLLENIVKRYRRKKKIKGKFKLKLLYVLVLYLIEMTIKRGRRWVLRSTKN